MAEIDKYKWALPIGTIINGGLYPYEIVDVLGHGGFGITYKVKARVNLNNIRVEVFFALKEYFPTGCWRGDDGATMQFSKALDDDMRSGLKDFVTEGQRLQKICSVNPHIVNVNEVFQANGTAYFVMEYLSGGDLREMVKKNGGALSEAAMLSILNPIAGAIDAVHQNHILHLDIKPENIVMRQGEVGTPDVPVLIDFGIAVHFDNRGNPTTTRPTKGVSQGYSPSEQFAGVKRFDPRLDIYALSATCYYMLTGKDPQGAFEIEQSDIIAELSPKVSKRTRDAIVHGMARMANQRPSSISEFLKGFKETSALPIGTIIQAPVVRYMVMAVIDEKPSYVKYKATLSSGNEQHRENDTRGTSRILYDLYEQLDNGKRIEGSDDTALPWDLPELGKARYEEMKYGFQASKAGGVSSEYFNIAGVQYLALCEGYKTPPKERKPREPREPLINWSKVKRPLLIALAALALAAVAALAVWGVSKLLQNKGTDEDSSVSEESSSELVSDVRPSEENPSEVMQEPTTPKKEEMTSAKPDESKNEADKNADKKAKDDAKNKAQDDNKKTDNKSADPDKQWPNGKVDTKDIKRGIDSKGNGSNTGNKSLDDQAIEAGRRHDNATLINLARQGSEKAKVICNTRGIKW